MDKLDTLEAAEYIEYWYNKKPSQMSIDLDERGKYGLCIAAWDISDECGNRGYCRFRIEADTVIFIISVLTDKICAKVPLTLFEDSYRYKLRLNKKKVRQLLSYTPTYHRALMIDSILADLE